MKTAIICTMWLDGEYIPKTHKFIKYYMSEDVQRELGNPDIWMIDNASDSYALDNLHYKFPIGDEECSAMQSGFWKTFIKKYYKHYTRTAHLEYPYCWRALYFARDLFQEYDYDKVIFMNNDSFIVSKKMMNFVRDLDGSVYWTPWCPIHNFPECEIQVITKSHRGFWNMTATPYIEHNGEHMETIIPAIYDNQFNGDRWAEYGMDQIPEDADYSTQTRIYMEVKYRE